MADKTYDVLVTRDITESCSMLISAPNEDVARLLAFERAQDDQDLVWELDDPKPRNTPYVTNIEVSDGQA